MTYLKDMNSGVREFVPLILLFRYLDYLIDDLISMCLVT